MSPWPVVAGVFLLGCTLVRAYLRFAARHVLDVPGARSSHLSPTPTGGGIGAIAALACGALVLARGDADWLLVIGLACGLSLVGLRDDLRSLPVLPRLLAQAAAAATVVAAACSGPQHLALTLPQAALLTLALAWLVNAFNFMDGIDGLAGGQAVFVAVSGAVLALQGGAQGATPAVLLCTAAAAAAFLCFNWPPARLFMGDAGSLAFGFLLAAAIPLSAGRGELAPATWLILWSPFLCDTVLTLGHRALRGESLPSAHRDHAYQRLARAWGGHRPVTLAVLALDLFWLLPLATIAERVPQLAGAALALALLPVATAVAWAIRRYPGGAALQNVAKPPDTSGAGPG
jgi:Fuc2NAc and GlcNAc transferase